MKIPRKSEYRYFLFAIADEIAWCKKRKGTMPVSPEYEKGFIKGLEQAQRLISKTKKMIVETNAELPVERVSKATRERMSESAKAGWKMRRGKGKELGG